MYAGAVVVPAVFGAMGAVGRRCAALGLNAEQIVDALSAGAIADIGGLSSQGRRMHPCDEGQGRHCRGFTRAFACGLAADGIIANCFVPGLICTQRKRQAGTGATEPPITGKSGPDHDVVAMVSFLCGPAARYITGQAIHASGGAYLGG